MLLWSLTITLSQAQTPVGGGIFADVTWTLSNSPYIMTGPVVVFPGRTLTIEPGVEVRVKNSIDSVTGLSPYLEIRGSLVAVGNINNPIVFTGDTLPTEVTWMGISIKATQGGLVNMDFFELNNSFYGIYADNQNAPTWNLNHCKFNYNNYAIQPFGPINFTDCSFKFNGQAIGSNFQINHLINVKRTEFLNNFSCNGFQDFLNVDSCIIRDNVNGIWYSGGSVSNTLFERNTYAIYAVSGPISNCTFNQNIFGLMEYSGVADSCFFAENGQAAEVADGADLTNSTFLNDTVAVVYASSLNASSQRPIILNNKICGSVNYYVVNKSDINFELDQNCFCEQDSTIIEGLIFDGYDDFTRGLLNYTIYDSTCSNVIRTVQKVLIPTSINELQAAEFSLFPVPASDQLFMNVPESLIGENLLASIHDLQGRLIGQSVQVNSKQIAFDISDLPSGMYIVNITGELSSTLKFVK